MLNHFHVKAVALAFAAILTISFSLVVPTMEAKASKIQSSECTSFTATEARTLPYKKCDQNESIARLQKILGIRSTGKFDEATYQKVLTFQSQNNLQTTGNLDLPTLDFISGEYGNGRGDQPCKFNITREQRPWKKCDYSTQLIPFQRYIGVDADGFIGRGTTRAIKEFQTRNGLSPTGNIDDKTWAMYQSVANSQSSKTTTQYPPPATSASGLSKPSGSCAGNYGKTTPNGVSVHNQITGEVYKCQNGNWIQMPDSWGLYATPKTSPPATSAPRLSKPSGSCALNDGTPVSNGKSNTNRDGSVYKCQNGTWILTSQPSGGRNYQQPKNQVQYIRTICQSKFLYKSSFSGDYYSWTIWDEYSNGSRGNYKSSAGYNPPC